MQNGSGIGRNAARAAVALAAVLGVGMISAPGMAEPAGTAVTVQVINMRNTDGVVRACMTRDQARFPRCQGSSQGYSVVVPAGQARTLRFANVAPGTYAIALLHDENDNGRADRALGMMPKEGFGFSNDAPVRMGPPTFDDASITVGNAPVRQTIHMRYML